MSFRDRIKGKYAIEKKLGQGSFGEVFTCYNTHKSNNEELLVIKIIHIDCSLESSSVSAKNTQEDAKREAKILRQLNHKVN
jgi:serine/threonine protein kinase